ncbi:unnamed protein product [Paramecium pentaurelia]|uniref:Uncharacterized protein n=1 Tax=Paramecium pentaurelia TaxID=43138 RepID=A0A8S1THC8_9CILI|nr:unnamed protein product [Paramecium pentaurelia]
MILLLNEIVNLVKEIDIAVYEVWHSGNFSIVFLHSNNFGYKF